MKDIEKYICPFCHSEFKECKKIYHSSCYQKRCACFSYVSLINYSTYDCCSSELGITSLRQDEYYYINLNFYREHTFLRSCGSNNLILNYLIAPELINDHSKILSFINNIIYI